MSAAAPALWPVQLTEPDGPVVLREFTDQDVDQALALVGDDRVTTWLSFDSRSREDTAAMLSGILERARNTPRTEYYLATTRSSDGLLVGFVRLAFAGVQAGKLGYATAADHWGHGYSTAAARLMVNFGFEQLGLHRISAAIGPDNAASIALIKRLGFQHEGTLRDHVYTNGSWRDSRLYSILAAEHVPPGPHQPPKP